MWHTKVSRLPFDNTIQPGGIVRVKEMTYEIRVGLLGILITLAIRPAVCIRPISNYTEEVEDQKLSRL